MLASMYQKITPTQLLAGSAVVWAAGLVSGLFLVLA